MIPSLLSAPHSKIRNKIFKSNLRCFLAPNIFFNLLQLYSSHSLNWLSGFHYLKNIKNKKYCTGKNKSSYEEKNVFRALGLVSPCSNVPLLLPGVHSIPGQKHLYPFRLLIIVFAFYYLKFCANRSPINCGVKLSMSLGI